MIPSLPSSELTFPVPTSSPAPFFPRGLVFTTMLSLLCAIAVVHFRRVVSWKMALVCSEVYSDVSLNLLR
jgi:hypothetical protein